jgi:hypothetical protein
MKKLMEDEEFVRNVQATYFATSAGIRVEEGRGSSGYWSSVMRKAETMKIRCDDLEEAKDKIQDLTGWDDPVETLSAVVQVSNCLGHEVWVDEKRRRTDEQGPKRQEKEKGKQKEERMPTATTEKLKPAFKLQSDIEHETDIAGWWMSTS